MAVMVTAIVVASGIFALQRGRMALLRAENQALVAEKGNPRIVSKVSLSPAPGREPNPFPTTQEELSRLRQEVAQLAGELEAAEARARQHAGRLSNSASSRADQRGLRVPFSNSAGDLASNDPPSFQYSANVRVTVPWNQTAVTGGWQLPTGNRGFVLATPNQGEDTAHLRIETQVVELSQATAERLGLGGPSAEERETQYSMVLATDQVQALLKTPGEAARVMAGTASAVMGMLTEIQLGTSGPVLSFMPVRNSTDGSGIEMQLTAKLTYSR